jgi:acyl transferase domain-containing protein/aryl carrier-like protein
MEKNEPAFPLAVVEAHLRLIIGSKLGLEPGEIESTQAFFSLGVNSLVSEEIRLALLENFTDLSSTVLFEHPNLERLSRHLIDRMAVPIDVEPLRELLAQPAAPEDAAPANGADADPGMEATRATGTGGPGRAGRTEIAVIGISGRFPKAATPGELWKNLVANLDCVQEIPASRWDALRLFSPDGKSESAIRSKWGGFIDGIEYFDPLFFRMSPREAELLDPQQKLFLQCAWEVMEDGGYGAAERRPTDKVGVYVGVTWNEFSLLSHDEGAHKGGGSLYWGIPNRASYFLNLSGPSQAIDTACSSSLVAVHSACLSLQAGECDMAIAGGVNLNLHPAKYVFLGQNHFTSSDGKCRSFGEGGDGYVPGEGVAAVLLKPLHKAIGDGDHIYGVIRGSATNHGGKATGYTVPNPQAHAALIRTALQHAQVDPAQVEYVECHGTGTALGDPIEIRGLCDAYGLSAEAHTCRVGSLKSNIGHLEAAAGIAGLIKILLSMKHGMLPASLHGEIENRHIDFARTPFSLVKRNTPWPLREGRTTRIAGLSSFGAGGSNAHLVVESFEPALRPAVADGRIPAHAHARTDASTDAGAHADTHWIALSTQTPAQLVSYARKLADFIDELFQQPAQLQHYRLADIAHTLSACRTHFSARLLVAAQDLRELQSKLRRFDGSPMPAEGVHVGTAKAPRGVVQRRAVSVLTAPAADAAQQAQAWTQGALEAFPFPPRGAVRKLPLPTYPFLRERSWLSQRAALAQVRPIDAPAATLHPLLDRNVSTLRAQAFETTLRRADPHLRDHLVSGEHVLPGVCHLEMAAVAAGLSLAADSVTLGDVWFTSVIALADATRDVRIELVPKEAHVAWAISAVEDGTPFSRGKILARSTSPAPDEAPLDLDAITRRTTVNCDIAEAYRQFRAIDIIQERTFQVLRMLRFNEREALARLQLDESLAADFDRYRLHPTLMDGAVQTAMLLLQHGLQRTVKILPFHFGEVRLLRPLAKEVWVHARLADLDGKRFDIDLCDASGHRLVEIGDFILKDLKPAGTGASVGAAAADRLAAPTSPYFAPVWHPAPLLAEGEAGDVPSVLVFCRAGADLLALRESADFARTRLVEVRFGSALREHGEDRFEIDPADPAQHERLAALLADSQRLPRHVLLWPAEPPAGMPTDRDADLGGQIVDGVRALFLLCKALHSRAKALTIVCLTRGEQPALLALSGFFKSLVIEQPAFRGRVVQVESHARAARDQWAHCAYRELSRADAHTDVAYRGGVRTARGFERVPAVAGAGTAPPFKAGGVYLISGGMGGIGLTVARHLSAAYRARVVLLGRAPLDAQKEQALQDIAALGGSAAYVACDIARAADVQAAVQHILAQAGRLDGVLHAAGVVRDDFLLNKSAESFDRVLAPKVFGTAHLDWATRDLALDCFVVFSSATAILGNLGQCDYGYGNAFADQFCIDRQRRVEQGARQGRSLSINWPYWQAGGMRLTQAQQAGLRRRFGLVPLSDEHGLQALEWCLQSGRPQVAVLQGDAARIDEVLQDAEAPGRPMGVPAAAATAAAGPALAASFDSQHLASTSIAAAVAASHNANAHAGSAAAPDLQHRVAAYLKALLAQQLKLPLDRLESSQGFDHYGLDSIAMVDLIGTMEERFGKLPKTLFFEHQCIDDLVVYFVENHPQSFSSAAAVQPDHEAAHLVRHLATQRATGDSATSPSTDGAGPPARFLPLETGPEGARQAVPALQARHAAQDPGDEPIAIIGLAGRYPMADTLDEFWRNLESGRDCVTEIPPERWAVDAYSAAPDALKSTGPGKSYGRWGSFLRDVDRFDATHFHITPKEAELMDPQERLFLQCAAQAIEDAGYRPEHLDVGKTGKAGRVGVYVGSMWGDYQLHGDDDGQRIMRTPQSFYWSIANRVSYFFNFSGPSFTVDSACSSSFTALKLACDSLQRGETRVAIAGAVNLSLHPQKYALLSRLKFLSTDGRCRAFGEGGDGYVPGEGVGAVVLKRLSQALHDRDHVHGVIRAGVLNHGGRTSGFTVPNPLAQASLVSEALAAAGVSAAEIGYVEAHGTGTDLGDPVEIAGLGRAFAGVARQSCPIGSVKSNLGHLEAAAGMVALTKVLLQFKHQALVPSIHSNALNPKIDFPESPFRVQQVRAAWPRKLSEQTAVQAAEQVAGQGGTAIEWPRIAGISSFGAGGSNAHFIVEEAPAAARPAGDAPVGRAELVTYSARTAERLRAVLGLHEAFLRAQQSGEAQASLADIAYTLNTGRVALEHRLALVVRSSAELIEKLQQVLANAPLAQDVHADVAASASEAAPPPGFNSGSDAIDSDTIDRWLQERNLSALAAAWVRGHAIDLAALYAGERRHRVSLPVYPFAGERYWIGGGEAMARLDNPRSERPPVAAAVPTATPAAAMQFLKQAIAGVTGLPIEGVRSDTAFQDLGIDSVMVQELVARLERRLGPLSKTLFYEYRNVRELASFLAAEFPRQLAEPATMAAEAQADTALARPSAVPEADSRADSRAESRAELRAESRVQSRLESRAESRADGLAELRVDWRAESRAESLAPSRPSPSLPEPAPADAPEPIAVIGFSGMFPQAEDMEAFWDNLRSGKDCIEEIPPSRWDHRSLHVPGTSEPGKVSAKWGGFVPHVDCFDPLFFQIPPVLARQIDPQERLFLQVAWQTLESAGYTPAAMADPRTGARQVGVFVGFMWSHYGLIEAEEQLKGNPAVGITWNSSIANRVSHFCDFKGPSYVVDVACASSLLAVHLACESLRRGECSYALAGGVNLSIHPAKYKTLTQMGMLSSDGRCRAFGAGGDGYVPGEGVGAVLLKPLRQAERDGDTIYMTLLGSSVGHGGHASGYTVPSPHAQAQVIADALRAARVSARDIGYVEAHGTGTALGDPIEIAGLSKCFREQTADNGFCAIGSVKSNIGHLEAAAGIASLLKVLLQMMHGQLVPSLHAQPSNPNIDFSNTPFVVQQTLREWPRRTMEATDATVAMQAMGTDGSQALQARTALVNSFAAGGTNVSMVVQEYGSPLPPRLHGSGDGNANSSGNGECNGDGGEAQLIVLSARHDHNLRAAVRRLHRHLSTQRAESGAAAQTFVLRDVAYTLHVGREAMAHRLAFVAHSMDELVRMLATIADTGDWSAPCAQGACEPIHPADVDAAQAAALQHMLARRDLDGLARLWVAGCPVDWRSLYPATGCRKLLLPTYAFSRERHWMAVRGAAGALCAVDPLPAGPAPSQPKPDATLTSFDRVEFRKTFRVDDALLRDHRVRGEHVLPGAACLEMARTAGALAMGRAVTSIADIVWPRPFTLAAPAGGHGELVTRLVGHGGEARFECLSHGEAARPLVHAQGRLRFEPAKPVAALDLARIRQRCRDSLSAQQIYAAAQAMGVEHGESLRAIEGACRNQHEALATLRLPEGAASDARAGMLPPALLDAALVSVTAIGAFDPRQARVPFAIDRIDLWQPVVAGCLVHAVMACAADGGDQYDLTVCDPSGRVLAAVLGFRLKHGLPARPGQSRAWVSAAAMRPTADVASTVVRRLVNLPTHQPTSQPADLAADQPAHQRVLAARPQGGDLLRAAQAHLAAWFSDAMEMPRQQVDMAAPFDRYGIDSIMILRLTRSLENEFGALPRTLFFEYRSLERLAEYLADHHADRLAVLVQGPAADAAVLPGPAEPARALVPPGGALAAGAELEAAQAAVAGVHAVAAAPAERPTRPAFAAGGQAPSPGAASPAYEPIAIVGLSGRYPQADDLDTFWRNLVDGKDCITAVPAERWDADAMGGAMDGAPDGADASAAPGPTRQWGGFLSDVASFDAAFFNMSPKEAETLDPSERLFLETVSQTLEDAGYGRERTAGRKIGMFVGVMWGQYQLYGTDPSLVASGQHPNSSFASIANRASYWFDLRGPSLAIDSMCSSSLAAIHLACRSLHVGECEAAIAGGVNLTLHPNKYLLLGNGRFLSSEGRCRSFGEGGDGYVPGEGVGAVMLKPLRRAQQDGDQVYGVIHGSALNHGGKTNGYHVPDPRAQAEVIRDALAHAGWDPGSISCLEAHGTGTALGDPIEIEGLTQGLWPQGGYARQACAIGSVKSNIGHLEAAAGIAGLTKLLLQMKHGRLVPSLHAEQLNSHIDFGKSPFRVQRQCEAWEPLRGGGVAGVGAPPRRAGLSSFGAGGANAHLLVQACTAPARRAPAQQRQRLVVLSARDASRLELCVSRLADFLQQRIGAGIDAHFFADLEYTLQVGRSAAEQRLVFVVSDVHELLEQLQQFLRSGGQVHPGWRGDTRQPQARLAGVMRGAPGDEFLRTLMANGDLAALAQLWCIGVDIDWELQLAQLPADERPRRMSLPTSPFVREKYWLGERPWHGSTAAERIDSVLHPLLHRNTSDLREQRYSSRFSGSEFYLRDHVVHGQRVLPAVAVLEMARAAAHDAAGQPRCLELRNIAWTRPVVVAQGQPLTLHISLQPDSGGELAFTVYGDAPADAGPVVHSKGRIALAAATAAPRLDVDALRQQCREHEFTAAKVYGRFALRGLAYGPAQQGLQSLHRGVDAQGRPQVLARLAVPAAVDMPHAAFALHPAVMDAALQATLGLLMDADGEQAALPFALDALVFLAPCPTTGWAWVRDSVVSDAPAALRKFDLDICDDAGEVRVQLRGLALRATEAARMAASTVRMDAAVRMEPAVRAEALGGGVAQIHATRVDAAQPDAARVHSAQADAAPAEAVETVSVLARPQWHHGGTWDAAVPEAALDAHWLLVSRELQGGMATLQRVRPQWSFVALEADYEAAALQVLALLQRVLAGQPQRPVPVQVLVPASGPGQLLAGLGGLLKTARQENPLLLAQLIEVDALDDAQALAGRLQQDAARGTEAHLRYEQGERRVAGWAELTGAQAGDQGGEQAGNQAGEHGAPAELPWKPGGVYLISGGAGGLGLLVAEEIARKAGSATLVLTGRSALDAARQERLRTLQVSGCQVIYRRIDVANPDAVAGLIDGLVAEHGTVDGIVHCAGVTRDSFLIRKTAQDLREVLRPKVAGLVNLDEASRGLPLGCFILFSSIAGALGNVGQADYAAANGFMDAYARYRNNLVAMKRRHGRTLSVNWPLWAEGGMRPDGPTEQLVMQRTGMKALGRAAGIEALYRAWASGEDQVLVLHGQRGRLLVPWCVEAQGVEPSGPEQVAPGQLTTDQLALGPMALAPLERRPLTARPLTPTPLAPERLEFAPGKALSTALGAAASGATGAPVDPAGEEALQDRTVRYFKQLLSAVIKLPAERIDAGEPLERYGIDSVMVMALTAQLERTFGPLSKTLFFEYQTIGALSAHFLRVHRAKLLPLLGAVGREGPATAATAAVPHAAAVQGRARFGVLGIPHQASAAQAPAQAQAQAIAIIGLSGRYPKARDVNEFWENLKAGRDCITEVPAERWDHGRYFDAEKGKPGKTCSRWGGFIDGVDRFDPMFFKLSPREADTMDPQERLFLQEAWASIEDAGYTPPTLSDGRRVGVFVGVMNGHYPTGVRHWSVANRVSSLLDFSGPSLAVDTACSSSLTALHLACQSLRAGECEVAIAGGVNLIVDPKHVLGLSAMNMLSSGPACKPFGDGADGFVDGEAVGAVVLKPLARAIADQDQVYGVIKATMVNAGGRTHGYTVPNPNAQAQLVLDALARAQVHPRAISCIEAHGTGTALGDPIEIAGLAKAFGQHTPDKQFCAIGSVKSNIGHAESAAGIAGLTKVLLQMKHRLLVPSLHAQVLNPHIAFEDTPFVVQRELAEWKRPLLQVDGRQQELPRLAGVSSFGAGGANAHVLIEEHEAPPRPPAGATLQPAMVVLSARTEDALRQQVLRLLAWLAAQPGVALDELAYTLQVGREAMEERLAVVADSVQQLQGRLQAQLRGEPVQQLYRGQARRHKELLSLLDGDEDMAQLVSAWASKGRYDKLLELWAKGHAVDWSALHGGRVPRRISLPTYPFARQRCWFDVPRETQPGAQDVMATGGPDPRPDADADPGPDQPLAVHGGTGRASGLPSRPALARATGAAAAAEIARGLGLLIDEVLGTQVSSEFSADELAGLSVASLGMDSLSGMALRKRVRAWLDVDLPPDIVVDAPTFLTLAERIHERLLLDQLTQDSPPMQTAAEQGVDEVFVV